jgi:ATP-binding cassette subfamily C protein LapB
MLAKMVRTITQSGRMGELMAASVAIHILGLGSALYSTNVLNRYVSVGITATLVTLTAGVVLAIVFEVLLRNERQKVLDVLASRGDDGSSQRLFDAFARPSCAALGAVPLPVRREALSAPAALQQLNSHANLAALLDAPFLLLYVVAMGLLYAPLGVLAAMACAVTLLLGVLGERQARKPAEEHAKAASRAQQMGQFLLTAGETLRGLPMLAPLARRWQAVQSQSLGSRRSGMFEQAHLQHTIQTVGQVLTVAVYAVGAAAAVTGSITTGALIGASILAGRAFSICSRAAYLADPLVRAGRAEAALAEVHALAAAASGSAQPAGFEGRLEVADLAHAYRGQPVPVFERLSLDLTPGQVLVVTGPNGAGKSTLVKLMSGVLQPDRGMVRADGIELRQLAPAWWHRHTGYAPQEPVFFDGSLRENLCLDREVDEGALLALMKEVGLEGFLASDPEGLDRQITSHDTGLAMGQRRRLVLVRALLGDPRIVFFDEPTEGLDVAGQAAVARLLSRLAKEGRTLVIASNEAFILRAADRVLDMSRKPTPALGRVGERGAAGPGTADAPPADAVDSAPAAAAAALPIPLTA